MDQVGWKAFFWLALGLGIFGLGFYVLFGRNINVLITNRSRDRIKNVTVKSSNDSRTIAVLEAGQETRVFLKRKPMSGVTSVGFMNSKGQYISAFGIEKYKTIEFEIRNEGEIRQIEIFMPMLDNLP